MEGRTKGVFAQQKEEQRNEALKEWKKEGIIIGDKNIIQELLKNYTIDETSKLIKKIRAKLKKIMSIDQNFNSNLKF